LNARSISLEWVFQTICSNRVRREPIAYHKVAMHGRSDAAIFLNSTQPEMRGSSTVRTETGYPLNQVTRFQQTKYLLAEMTGFEPVMGF
jgi:hypothetical protein